MWKYALRRILTAIPVLFGILLLTFLLVRMIPGDPCYVMLGERARPQACEAFYAANGLDKPVWEQFFIYISKIARGDFGESIRYSRPVSLLLVERLPVTIELSIAALVVALVVGLPLGIISAVRHNTAIDVGTMIFANFGVSIPVFWLGLMLAYTFALVLKDTPLQLPPSGRLTAGLRATPFFEVWGWSVEKGTNYALALEFIARFYILNSLMTQNWEVLGATLRHLILPAVTLSTIPMAVIARITRSSLLEVLGLDYVRTARAKGLLESRVILKHALRNALLPVVTIVGLQLGLLLGGAILTETIFGLSGVGRAMYDAITGRDYTIIQAFVIVIAVIYVTLNLLVDLSYAYLDPRIRLN